MITALGKKRAMLGKICKSEGADGPENLRHYATLQKCIQRSAKGLENFVPDVAEHFCLQHSHNLEADE